MIEEIKEILKEYNKDIKRHIDVLKEDFDSKVSLIGEQYGSIENNLEIIKNDIEIIKNSLKKKVDIEEFETLEARVRALESKIK